jgi:hypothetical protein
MTKKKPEYIRDDELQETFPLRCFVCHAEHPGPINISVYDGWLVSVIEFRKGATIQTAACPEHNSKFRAQVKAVKISGGRQMKPDCDKCVNGEVELVMMPGGGMSPHTTCKKKIWEDDCKPGTYFTPKEGVADGHTGSK